MGKDIDRNITRQLWERFKNTFSRNDVIPVENGGTGVKSLERLYPKLVSDEKIKLIKIKEFQLLPGFTLEDDSNAEFTINKNSMYIEGLIHVTSNTNVYTNTYMQIELPNFGYNIKNVQFYSYKSRFSIVNNILSFDGYFSQSSKQYKVILNAFVPFI